jgi:hypothetical protein
VHLNFVSRSHISSYICSFLHFSSQDRLTRIYMSLSARSSSRVCCTSQMAFDSQHRASCRLTRHTQEQHCIGFTVGLVTCIPGVRYGFPMAHSCYDHMVCLKLSIASAVALCNRMRLPFLTCTGMLHRALSKQDLSALCQFKQRGPSCVIRTPLKLHHRAAHCTLCKI